MKKIHLIKELKFFEGLFSKQKTLCGKTATHWKFAKYAKTDFSNEPSLCTCNNCLIKHEKRHLEEALI